MALETRRCDPRREPVAQAKHCVCQADSVFNCLRDAPSLFIKDKESSQAFANGCSYWQWLYHKILSIWMDPALRDTIKEKVKCKSRDI